MNLVYCACGFLLVFSVYRNVSPALFCPVLIFSHWLFDFVSWPLEVIGSNHGIQVFTQSSEIGLGLYRSAVPALLCELTLLSVGVGLYVIDKRKTRRVPR